MHTAKILIIGTVTTLAIGLGAAPAGAVDAHDTAVTFVIAAGALTIAVPASATITFGGSGSQLGPVTVTDARSAADGTWAATATSTSFTTGSATASETIAASLVNYWSGPSTSTSGNGTFTAGEANSTFHVALDITQAAFDHAGGTGNNSATWNPTLYLSPLPANVAGSYAGTVTHSVS